MKKYTNIKAFVLLSILSIPLFVSAQERNIEELIGYARDLVKSLIILVAGIALLAFFWGLAKFIFKAGDEKAQAEGKNIMKWGLIALFVMVSVWGIIGFFQDELGLNEANELPEGFPVADDLIRT